MKILFIHLLTRANQRDILPVGYGNIMGYIDKHGHESEIIFPRANNFSDADIESFVRKTDAGVVGMGGTFNELHRAVKLTRMVKAVRPDIKVVLGGPLLTYCPDLAMRKSGADLGIRGDGEIATKKLLDSMEQNEMPYTLPGLVYWDGQTLEDNGYAEMVDMNDVEYPDWNKFPMDYYLHLDNGISLDDIYGNSSAASFSWVFSRGCIGKCNFCSPGGRPRFMKPKRLVDKIEEIILGFNLGAFRFADNIIGPSEKYILEMCDELSLRSIGRVDFTGNLRADQVTSNITRALKSVGFTNIGMGIESASNNLLKKMGKKVTVEQIENTIRIIKDSGMTTLLSCMFGQPGETLEDCVNTFKLFVKASDCIAPHYNGHFFSPLHTYPGAPIYDYALESGFYDDDDHFYHEFFNAKTGGFKNYTHYSDETLMKFVSIGRMLNTWSYCKNQKTFIENSIMNMHQCVDNDIQKFQMKSKGQLNCKEIEDLLDSWQFKEKKIALYGISDVAELVKACLESGNCTVVAACDGYKDKLGNDFHGLSICSLDELDPSTYDVLMICTKSFHSDNQIVDKILQTEHGSKKRVLIFTGIQQRKLYLHARKPENLCTPVTEESMALRTIIRDIL